MIDFPRLAALSMLAWAWSAAAPPALADRGWMTEDALRRAFVGKTIDGHYVDGMSFTESYTQDGRLDYRDERRNGLGSWVLRNRIFCTFYDPGQDIVGGCFIVAQTSANCYEFYSVGASERDADKEPSAGLAGRWTARAARRGDPSTCAARPTV
jgi:hypothetical protein